MPRKSDPKSTQPEFPRVTAAPAFDVSDVGSGPIESFARVLREKRDLRAELKIAGEALDIALDVATHLDRDGGAQRTIAKLRQVRARVAQPEHNEDGVPVEDLPRRTGT